jgi:hypothetical protein
MDIQIGIPPAQQVGRVTLQKLTDKTEEKVLHCQPFVLRTVFAVQQNTYTFQNHGWICSYYLQL